MDGIGVGIPRMGSHPRGIVMICRGLAGMAVCLARSRAGIRGGIEGSARGPLTRVEGGWVGKMQGIAADGPGMQGELACPAISVSVRVTKVGSRESAVV